MAVAAPVQIILGIPGVWRTRSDTVQAIAAEAAPYIFVGITLMNTDTKHMCEMEIYEHDPSLRGAFAAAGKHSLTEDDLDAIAAHTLTPYLIGTGGSVEAAIAMLDAGYAILRAGGLAVKVETSGIAHSASDWRSFAERDDDVAVFRAFVTFVRNGDDYYSCGMHTLGHRDAIVRGNGNAAASAALLQTFLFYVLHEHPTLKAGETFSVDAHSQYYRLIEAPSDMYPPDHPFTNPFGMWRLTPA